MILFHKQSLTSHNKEIIGPKLRELVGKEIDQAGTSSRSRVLVSVLTRLALFLIGTVAVTNAYWCLNRHDIGNFCPSIWILHQSSIGLKNNISKNIRLESRIIIKLHCAVLQRCAVLSAELTLIIRGPSSVRNPKILELPGPPFTVR